MIKKLFLCFALCFISACHMSEYYEYADAFERGQNIYLANQDKYFKKTFNDDDLAKTKNKK